MVRKVFPSCTGSFSAQLPKRYEGKVRWDSYENMGEARNVNKGFSIACRETLVFVNTSTKLGCVAGGTGRRLERISGSVSVPTFSVGSTAIG